MRSDSDDYRKIFLDDIPLMDVRAPVEFEQGSFPNAVNVPLLDDVQREQIGIRYKQAGEQKAIELGLQLATPQIRAQRLESWITFCQKHSQGYLYCFRGGLRSRTTQQWLREQGFDYPLIKGGYKSMRRFLIDELAVSAEQLPLVIVSGLTGSGKTRLLTQISRHIDLEGIANHRGSAFGRDSSDRQPGPIDWENALSIALLKLRSRSTQNPVFVEDEGRRIGRANIPQPLYEKMMTAPRAILQLETQKRVELITQDYILHAWPTYQNEYGDKAQIEFSGFVLDNLARIQKRLGSEHFKRVKTCFELALVELYKSGSAELFYDGIRILLEHYYDPMYRYQLANKDVDIIFEGPQEDYLQWAEDYLLQQENQVEMA